METVKSERRVGKKKFYPIDKTLGIPQNSHHNLCKSTHKFRFLEELDLWIAPREEEEGGVRKELWKLKYFTMRKYDIQKIL
jgi:hypothetical protein